MNNQDGFAPPDEIPPEDEEYQIQISNKKQQFKKQTTTATAN